MSDFLGFVICTLKPFFRSMEVVNDKQARTITFKNKEESRTLTYDELAEQIAAAFGQ